ncbi:hypothetical protein KKG71_04535 [Patescibacteria group bacterium]|nr:hypothetical protein [Patescibacteria group bacterium]
MNISKKTLIALTLVMVISLSACSIDINMGKDKEAEQNTEDIKSEPAKDIKSENTPAPKDMDPNEETMETKTENAQDLAGITKAMATKYEEKEENITITIEDNDHMYARGTVIFKDAVSGAWWLAFKADKEWEIVADGNGAMMCDDVEFNEFPVAMVETCTNDEGEEVSRR